MTVRSYNKISENNVDIEILSCHKFPLGQTIYINSLDTLIDPLVCRLVHQTLKCVFNLIV